MVVFANIMIYNVDTKEEKMCVARLSVSHGIIPCKLSLVVSNTT